MINIDHLYLCAEHHTRPIVSDFSLCVPAGQKWVLTGPSGSGKSSVLRALCAGIEGWQGQIRLAGQLLHSKSCHPLRRLLGYVPQELGSTTQRVGDFMAAFCCAAGLWRTERSRSFAAAQQLATGLFRRLLLGQELLQQDLGRLSGGQRQRVLLAAVLLPVILQQRPILLLDEVTSALDKEAADSVMKLIFTSRELQHTTLLSASHSPAWLERCDAVVQLT